MKEINSSHYCTLNWALSLNKVAYTFSSHTIHGTFVEAFARRWFFLRNSIKNIFSFSSLCSKTQHTGLIESSWKTRPFVTLNIALHDRVHSSRLKFNLQKNFPPRMRERERINGVWRGNMESVLDWVNVWKIVCNSSVGLTPYSPVTLSLSASNHQRRKRFFKH